ncbi:MAG: TAXI family TRAP transporter solute-binding subunit [Spirochaetaceae bacterium]|jgi:TRAP transporter TAXI family solute receptor|nr:TAXI family TRAP transporter solute-binding subunit [Spirochaetaceae bacterium]
MKKTVFFAAAVLLVLTSGLYAGGGKEKSSGEELPARIRMATGGNTGTYYAYGSAVGQILKEKTGIDVIVQSTGASKANIQLMDAGEVELALVQNDVMDYAWRGVDLFNGTKIQSFSALAALYPEAIQVVATSAIKTIADLKGKSVSVGDAGSGTEFNAWQILAAYGIATTDINKQNLSFGASAEALRDGKIDAFFCVAGAPTTAITELAISKDVVLLEIDDAHAAQIIQQYPFYAKFNVPAGSYRGTNKNTQTLAVKSTLIVSPKLSEAAVYILTKALFENKDAIGAAHAKGKELDPGYAVSSISTPFHPGATKYFKEIGAMK